MAGLRNVLGLPPVDPVPGLSAEVAAGGAVPPAPTVGPKVSIGAPVVKPTPGISASITPAAGLQTALAGMMGAMPGEARPRGMAGDMAEMGGRRAYATVPPVAPIAPTQAPANVMSSQLAKLASNVGGPDPNPLAAASQRISAALSPAGPALDPLATLKSRQFSDGFNSPGW